MNTPEIEQTGASPIEHTQYSFTYNGTPMQSEGSASDTVTVAGNSEFFQAISGRKSADMWAVMGELMDTLQAINPRLYNSVLRKINDLATQRERAVLPSVFFFYFFQKNFSKSVDKRRT